VRHGKQHAHGRDEHHDPASHLGEGSLCGRDRVPVQYGRHSDNVQTKNTLTFFARSNNWNVAFPNCSHGVRQPIRQWPFMIDATSAS
jgi:hypothetical protein